MLTSMGSRSSRSTRNSKDALIRPCSQAAAAGVAEHAPRPQLPCGGVTATTRQDGAASSNSRPASPGASPRRPIRSRAATSTTTGGRGSTTRRRAPSSRVATPCDSFHRWREDIQLVADMGLGAYRFSLEWSRIEPAEGEFSVAALEHYRRLCAACHGHGILPVVTFHHFTTPLWLTARGGWRRPTPPSASPGSSNGRRRTWATSSAGPAPSTSPTSSRSWGTSRASTRPGSRTTSPATPP